MTGIDLITPSVSEWSGAAWSFAGPAAPIVGSVVTGLAGWAFRSGRARREAKRQIAIALVQVQSDLARFYFVGPGKQLNDRKTVPEIIVAEIFGQYAARISEQAGAARGQGLEAPVVAVIEAYAVSVEALGPFWADRSNRGEGYNEAYRNTKRHLLNALHTLKLRRAYTATIEELDVLNASDKTNPVGPAGFSTK